MSEPVRISTPPKTVTLRGAVFPWSGTQPVLLAMPGSVFFYLPCFSTPEKLVSLMAEIRVSFDLIKQIQDPNEFLDSISDPHLKIILDPYNTPEGKFRFLEIADDPK